MLNTLVCAGVLGTLAVWIIAPVRTYRLGRAALAVARRPGDLGYTCRVIYSGPARGWAFFRAVCESRRGRLNREPVNGYAPGTLVAFETAVIPLDGGGCEVVEWYVEYR